MKIGIIGTGLMGLPMAQRLLDGGFSVMAYNRTPEKLEALRNTGVTIAETPHYLIQNSECIILMVTNDAAIRELLFASESRQGLADRTVIQMGTIAPTESQAISAEVADAGGDYLEAPVLGSIPEAKAGKLTVMVGASPEQFQKWLPVLQQFGTEPILIGSVGNAAATKLALNQLIGTLTTSFASSLGFLLRQGVDIDAFMKILRGSALYAPTFDKKLQRMVDRNFENPNFPTKHLLKDMRLFTHEAQELGLDVSGIEGVQTILERAIAQSLADADYSALYAAVDPKE